MTAPDPTRTKNMRFRATETEFKLLMKAAAKSGETFSDWARRNLRNIAEGRRKKP